MLAWQISQGSRVAALSGPWPKLLYTWLIAHADNLGRFHGEPEQVRSLVLPREPAVTSGDVEKWLRELAENRLVAWYTVDGMRYLQFPKEDWERHQRLDRMRTSDLPPPVTTSSPPVTTDNHRLPEVEVEVEVEKEDEKEVEREGEPREETQVQTVRKRTVLPIRKDPGPKFWNSIRVQASLQNLRKAGVKEELARSMVVQQAEKEKW